MGARHLKHCSVFQLKRRACESTICELHYKIYYRLFSHDFHLFVK